MLESVICKARGHRVNRRRVWDDGLSYRTNCERCRVPLIRGIEGWRQFDTNRDLDSSRRAHPHHA